uniref:hypothetical protein n=1 Tax=Leptospira kirschneri TaxID=29507 RepID=UPI00046C5E24
PGIARFTSADTLIDGELDTQGWNRFSYVKGNPIGAKDPTGHEANGGIGIMMNSQCKGNASCNSAGLNAVSEGAKKAVVGTAVVGATAATGYAAAAEVGSAALPSAIYLSSRLGSSNITNSLLNRLPQSQSAVANSVNATKEGLKKANSVGNIGNNPGNKKADFIVSQDGAVMHNSPGKVKDSLSKAGFPIKERDPSRKESGTIFNIPNKKMDVRVMDGGPNHPPRVVTTHEKNQNQSVNPNTGKNFGNMNRNEQQSRSHMYFQE